MEQSKNKIPHVMILTDSYKVSHFHLFNPEIAEKITTEGRKHLDEINSKLLDTIPDGVFVIPDLASIFDEIEDRRSPGFEELLKFLDGDFEKNFLDF